LEPRRPHEGELAVGHTAFVTVAVLRERAVIAEEDDPEPVGVGIVEPVVDSSLSRFVAEGRRVFLNQEIAALEPTERLAASDGNRRAENAVQGLILGLPAPKQRIEPLEFRVRRRYAEFGWFFAVHCGLLDLFHRGR
jgi:hypothetical protein